MSTYRKFDNNGGAKYARPSPEGAAEDEDVSMSVAEGKAIDRDEIWENSVSNQNISHLQVFQDPSGDEALFRWGDDYLARYDLDTGDRQWRSGGRTRRLAGIHEGLMYMYHPRDYRMYVYDMISGDRQYRFRTVDNDDIYGAAVDPDRSRCYITPNGDGDEIEVFEISSEFENRYSNDNIRDAQDDENNNRNYLYTAQHNKIARTRDTAYLGNGLMLNNSRIWDVANEFKLLSGEINIEDQEARVRAWDDEYLYSVSGNGKRLRKIDLSGSYTKTEYYWNVPYSDDVVSVSMVDSYILIGDRNGIVYVVDKHSGQLACEIPVSSNHEWSSATYHDGIMYIELRDENDNSHIYKYQAKDNGVLSSTNYTSNNSTLKI